MALHDSANKFQFGSTEQRTQNKVKPSSVLDTHTHAYIYTHER